MISNEDCKAVKEFIGDRGVQAVYTNSGFVPYLSVANYFLEFHGIKVPGVYLGQKPEREGGGYGPIEPHMFRETGLLIIDGSLKYADYLEILRTLGNLKAFHDEKIMYVVGSPFEMLSPIDLLMRAYDRDGRTTVKSTGKPAITFAESHKDEVISSCRSGKPRIIGKRNIREYGIALALAIARSSREIYIEPEDSESSSYTREQGEDNFFVDIDEERKPILTGRHKKRRLLVMTASGRRARQAEKALKNLYTVRITNDLDEGIRGLLDGTYVPDAVFADAHLRSRDGSNGSSIAKKAKGIPVFLITKNPANTSFLEKAMGDGVRGVIVRPLTQQKVEGYITQIFDD